MGEAVYTEDVLRDLFLTLDSSGDGFLSYGELLDGLNNSEVDWETLEVDRRTVLDRIWTHADRDGNERVSFGEFWQLVSATRSPTEEEVNRAFSFFVLLDKSGDGQLDRLEIQEGLKNPDIDWELMGFDRDTYDRHIFKQADEDGDNRVSFDEFWQLVLRSIAEREAAKAEAAAQMVSINDFALWSAAEVGDWLDEIGFGQYRPAFEANNMHGYKLLGMTMDMLPRLQVRQFDHCKEIMRALRVLKGQEPAQMETLAECMKMRQFAAAKPIDGVHRDLRFGTEADFGHEEQRIQDEYSRPQMVMRNIV
eukprot:CAMPEP_0197592330 /NCGR_PEP_ID=MMETSP1326-20131121/15032_1 /TAXON_ID=1155430 /ORGANISM="Genus nov. species nov., Strain RCC2288" /LENGTH=307 /DNA_ID=CAMNT_0043158019 /DNA_START=241 /DNA_END=1167 /DNA_ORIENTATION=-